MPWIAAPYPSPDAAAARSPPQSWNLMNSLATAWCTQNSDADNKLLPTIWHKRLCSNQRALPSIGLPWHEPAQHSLEMGKASASACNQLPESLPGSWELEFAYIDDISCLPEKNSGDTDNVSPKKEWSACHQGLLYQYEAAYLVALIDYGFTLLLV